MTNLSNEEIRRYSRHLILPEFGMAGQRRLKEGSVLLIGTGGLGSPLALYLAAAGVGHIGLVDFDVVDESNLQRQIAHGTSTIGVRKTESARRRLNDLNPNVEVTTYEEQVCMARSSASRVRPRCSTPRRAGRAIAACTPSRRLPAWCQAAPRAACWVCYRA
jgi:molybdopterin/thiamine biosynthesis adenylyltransferase